MVLLLLLLLLLWCRWLSCQERGVRTPKVRLDMDGGVGMQIGILSCGFIVARSLVRSRSNTDCRKVFASGSDYCAVSKGREMSLSVRSPKAVFSLLSQAQRTVCPKRQSLS